MLLGNAPVACSSSLVFCCLSVRGRWPFVSFQRFAFSLFCLVCLHCVPFTWSTAYEQPGSCLLQHACANPCVKAFQKSHAFAEPPTFYCVCTSKLKKGGPGTQFWFVKTSHDLGEHG